jgi:hypothetical protein
MSYSRLSGLVARENHSEEVMAANEKAVLPEHYDQLFRNRGSTTSSERRDTKGRWGIL